MLRCIFFFFPTKFNYSILSGALKIHGCINQVKNAQCTYQWIIYIMHDALLRKVWRCKGDAHLLTKLTLIGKVQIILIGKSS